MKIFFSEGFPDYSTYTFNYGIYCLKESNSELAEIYDRGFLPYSGNPTLKKDIFYLARSLRINRHLFRETSENRRVRRKLEHLDISMQILEKSEFEQSTAFNEFCQTYADARMGGNMPPERLNYVYSNSTCTHIISYTHEDKPLGYVYCAIGPTYVQYWFSFFDLELMETLPVGKWMMWKTIEWAMSEGKDHVYLGTCYGEKSLYKVRDFKGAEYFDGYRWNADMSQLKAKCKSDAHRENADDFKAPEQMDQYLEDLLNDPL